MPTWQIVQNAHLVDHLQNAPYLLTSKQTNIIRVFVERLLIGTTTPAIRYNQRTISHGSVDAIATNSYQVSSPHASMPSTKMDILNIAPLQKPSPF